MKIINGFASCGKSKHLQNEVELLLKQHIQPDKICIVGMNKNWETRFSDIFSSTGVEVTGFQTLEKKFFLKIPDNYDVQTISDDLTSVCVIQSVSTALTKNTEMENLGKLFSFARELYNTFGILKINGITKKEEILNIAQSLSVNSQEYKRLELILNIYEQYLLITQKCKLADFRDVVISCVNSLKTNDVLKNIISQKYDFMFVTGAENITSIQLEFLKSFVDDNKLTLYGDCNAQVQEYMGGNVFAQEDFDEKLTETTMQKDIFERALAIIDEHQKLTTKPNNIDYKLFQDFEEEMKYIANDIKNKISHGCKASDIAVLVRNNIVKKNIADILIENGVEISDEYTDNEILHFKVRLSNMINLCEMLKKTGAKVFSKQAFEDAKNNAINNKTLVELKTLAEQFNLSYLYFLNEKFERPYNVNTLKFLQEKNNDLFLASTAFDNAYRLSTPDKYLLDDLNSDLRKLYDLFLHNNILEFISIVAGLNDDLREKTYIYHSFIAKFMRKTESINRMKLKIKQTFEELNNNFVFEDGNLSLSLLEELLNITLQESQKDEKVSLQTVFSVSGKKFKYVYIPNLVDEYFPKKTTSTYIISHSTDEKISAQLRANGYKNFTNLFFDNEQEYKSENNLMYLAMSSATGHLLLSTHKTENGKEIFPSVYFEKLCVFDDIKPVTLQNKHFEPQKTVIKDKELNSELTDVMTGIINADDNSKDTFRHVTKNLKNEIDNILDKNTTDETKRIKQQDNLPVLEDDEKLVLSASQIKNYQKCPKKFYFSKLLELSTKQNFSTNFGDAVHNIFQVAYTYKLDEILSMGLKTVLKNLADILFSSVKDDLSLKIAIDNGFIYVDEKSEEQNTSKKGILNNLRDVNFLDIAYMQKLFDKILGDLENIESIIGLNLYNKDGSKSARPKAETIKENFYVSVPCAAKCEKNFKFSFPEKYNLPNISFKGFIDAFVKYGDTWTLCDYKTGKNEGPLKWLYSQFTDEKITVENGDEDLTAEQLQLREEKALSNFQRFQYQVMLYYFACVFDENLNKEEYSNIKKMGYFYIRPKTTDGGVKKDFVDVGIVEKYLDDMIFNLKKYMINPIYSTSKFDYTKDLSNCNYCDYNDICDISDDEDEESKEFGE